MGLGSSSMYSVAVGGRGQRDLCLARHHMGETHLHRDTLAPATVVRTSVARARGVFKLLYISLSLILAVCPKPVLSVHPTSMHGTSLAHRP